MSLALLTSKDAVLRAIAECDAVGRDAFCEKYGFKRSREYVLIHEGGEYDSKPILAAAHGFQHPEQGPLTWRDFSGGPPTISKLESFGFKVRSRTDQPTVDEGNQTVWLIRAGTNGKSETLALTDGVAVIGWSGLGDLSHLPGREELKRAVAARWPSLEEGQIPSWAGSVYRFLHDVQVGDLVVLPLKTRPGRIALGRIAGPYEYRTGPGYDDDANNVRRVQWLATDVSYDAYDDDLVQAFGQQGTISQISKPEAAQRLLAAIANDPPRLHLVLKWSPSYGANTIDDHRSVVAEHGAVWWGRLATKPDATGMAANRLREFETQLASGGKTFAFLYSGTETWRAEMLDITTDRSEIDEALVPAYYKPDTHHILWVKLKTFEPSSAEEIMDGYVLAASGQPVTPGGLGNQTPLTIRDRAGAPPPPPPPPPPPQHLTVAAVKAAAEARGLMLDDAIYGRLVAALESGKHVILTGPPGTAKTTLAMVVASVAKEIGRSDGYVLTTATSDWTTYETIGGLRPQQDHSLIFEEGHFLSAIRANEWLVIDELNRSNFDRAFGQLFTVLSGQPVVLPYTRKGQTAPLVLVPADSTSPIETADELPIGKNWRVVATMNVFDKSLLFEMSFALMRRFAFIEIPSPSDNAFQQIIASRTSDPTAASVTESLLTLRKIKDVGPAVFIDIARYAEHRRAISSISDGDLAYEAFYSYLLPQFEGINDETGDALFKAVAKIVGSANRERLRTTLNAVLGVEVAAPNTGSPTVDDEEDPAFLS